MRYQVFIDWVGPGAGPLSGQTAIPTNTTGAAGAQTVAIFNGGLNGILNLTGDNAAPQVPGSGTAYSAGNALSNADLSTLLMGAATISGAGNGVTALNLANDIYTQWTFNGGNNPIQNRLIQFANPGVFGAG
jgi:hypothetical protein